MGLAAKYPSLPYVAPFAAFVAFLMLDRLLPAGLEALYPIRHESHFVTVRINPVPPGRMPGTMTVFVPY